MKSNVLVTHLQTIKENPSPSNPLTNLPLIFTPPPTTKILLTTSLPTNTNLLPTLSLPLTTISTSTTNINPTKFNTKNDTISHNVPTIEAPTANTTSNQSESTTIASTIPTFFLHTPPATPTKTAKPSITTTTIKATTPLFFSTPTSTPSTTTIPPSTATILTDNLLIPPNSSNKTTQPKSAPINSQPSTNPPLLPPKTALSNTLSAPVLSESKQPTLRLNSTSKKLPLTKSERFQNFKKLFKDALRENPLVASGIISAITPTKEQIANQTVLIFEDFIFIRLKQAGFGLNYDDEKDEDYNKRNSFTSTTNGIKSLDIRCSLYEAEEGADWFERWHHSHMPKLSDVSRDVHMLALQFETKYHRVCRKVTNSIMQQVKNELQSKKLISSFADLIFKNNHITWGRIVAMFSISASVATQCCRNNNCRLVKSVMAAHHDVTEKYVVAWVHAQGGWRSIFKLSRAPTQETKGLWLSLLMGACVALLVCVILFIHL